MQLVRVYFYKAKFNWIGVLFRGEKPHIIDDAIALWTGIWNWFTKPYAHCEIGVWIDGVEWMYTSTLRGDNNGVVKRPASEVLKNPGRWVHYEIEISDVSYAGVMEHLNYWVSKNKGYDKKALLRFFLPIKRKSNFDKFICSEFVQAAIVEAGVFPKCELLSPRRLSGRLNKMGLEAKQLK